MTRHTIPKQQHGTLGWLTDRHRHNGKCIVGASEVATVMLANDYESPVDLAVRKLQPPVVTEANEAMMRGNYLEPALITYASAELQRELLVPEVMYINEGIIATLDAVGADSTLGDYPDLVVECKTANRWTLADTVPASWWWQAQAQMLVTDVTEVQFAVLDKHMRLGMQTVVRNDDAIATMIAEVQRFCAAIDLQQLPADSELTAVHVATLYPQPSGSVEIDPTMIDSIERWQAIKANLKDLEQEERLLKDQIANALRDAEFGTVGGNRVLSYKAQTATRFDQKEFAKDYPEAAAKYMTATSFRVLRITK